LEFNLSKQYRNGWESTFLKYRLHIFCLGCMFWLESTFKIYHKHWHGEVQLLLVLRTCWQLVTSIQSIKASIHHLCSELHRDISRLRQQVTKFAGSRSTQGWQTVELFPYVLIMMTLIIMVVMQVFMVLASLYATVV